MRRGTSGHWNASSYLEAVLTKKEKTFCYRFVVVSTVGTLCVEISLHWSFFILILLLYPASLDC